jgi:hypothetical protein
LFFRGKKTADARAFLTALYKKAEKRYRGVVKICRHLHEDCFGAAFWKKNVKQCVFRVSGAMAGLYDDFEELKLWAFLLQK